MSRKSEIGKSCALRVGVDRVGAKYELGAANGWAKD